MKCLTCKEKELKGKQAKYCSERCKVKMHGSWRYQKVKAKKLEEKAKNPSYCLTCSKVLTGRQTKYCSKKCKGQDTNHLYTSYQAQKQRGKDRKLKAIENMGGGCQECGYNTNYSALVFHHVKAKEFALDLRRFSNSSQEVLDKELAKCKLLCHNCHCEHHNPNCML